MDAKFFSRWRDLLLSRNGIFFIRTSHSGDGLVLLRGLGKCLQSDSILLTGRNKYTHSYCNPNIVSYLHNYPDSGNNSYTYRGTGRLQGVLHQLC